MNRQHVERRSHARFPRTFEMEGTSQEGGVVARMIARDLSLGGLYCVSSVDFPEMTRLAVRIPLPERRNGDREPLDLEAIVVRRREVGSATGKDRFELALFFAGMSDVQRERLARFIAIA